MTTLPLPASRINEAGPFLPRSGANHLKKGCTRPRVSIMVFSYLHTLVYDRCGLLKKPYVTSEVLRALQVNNQFVNLQLPSEPESLERPLLLVLPGKSSGRAAQCIAVCCLCALRWPPPFCRPIRFTVTDFSGFSLDSVYFSV